MVRRRLNKPVTKIQSFPVFWLREVLGSAWRCRQCNKEKEKGSVAFEVLVRYARRGADKSEDKPVKMYCCLDCAFKLLDEAKDKVETCKRLGADAYILMDEM